MGPLSAHAIVLLALSAAALLLETPGAAARRHGRPVRGGACATVVCMDPYSPCFRKTLTCPAECPDLRPLIPTEKSCIVSCTKCEAFCRSPTRICGGRGSGCNDPRFIGGDGMVFYFHGHKDGHFALVSDRTLQINARFMGLRPPGRPRDFTWIQALGIMSGNHSLTLTATRAAHWDTAVDHLTFSSDGHDIPIPLGHGSQWDSVDNRFTVSRRGRTNAVDVTVAGIADLSVRVVPVTEEDSRIHSYQIPADDCFAHLDVQFRFHRLSGMVEGVLGRTYRKDYESPARLGEVMPVLRGEDRYETASLLSTDCGACVFDPAATGEPEYVLVDDDR